MTAAQIANEINANIGRDFTFADAYDAEYLDADAEDEDEAAARQALNARMADWYGIG